MSAINTGFIASASAVPTNNNRCALCGTPYNLEYCDTCGEWFCQRCSINYPGRVKAFIRKKVIGRFH